MSFVTVHPSFESSFESHVFVEVRHHVIAHIKQGHPWIYREAIVGFLSVDGKSLAPPKTGTWVYLTCAGELLGTALYDGDSPLALRIWSKKKLDENELKCRFRSAFELRKRWFGEVDMDQKTTAYRLLNGEGDRTPGVVIDRYGDVAVLRTDGNALSVVLHSLLKVITPLLRSAGISTMIFREVKNGEKNMQVLFGEPPPPRILVREHGISFWVDLLHGQKTGAFLDQRENRLYVMNKVQQVQKKKKEALSSSHVASVKVLNLFSYTGGFSLMAAIAGAHTTSVDSANLAHKTAQDNFARSNLDLSNHHFITADCYSFLEKAAKNRQFWDIVISDPPSFAPNHKSVHHAIKAYQRLHRACIKVLAAGGSFCASSCSSHVPMEDFLKTLDDASLGHDSLRLIEAYGPPKDHPTLPAFSEGRYLKFAVLE